MKKTFTLCLLLFGSVTMATVLHGDIHERILKVSEEIKKYPDSTYLFLKRSKLYFQHEDYQKSLIDLNKSNELGVNSIEQNLHYSNTYLKLENFSNGILYAQKVLTQKPNHVLALKFLAQNYFQLKNYKKSAIAYEGVIENSIERLPENYVDASIAWERINNQEGYENAEKIIKKGIDDLGNLISLYNRLRELALNQNDNTKAIKVQKDIIAIIPRKEFAYFKLSELYMLNNDKTTALLSLAHSKSCINKLPQRTQNTSFIKELKKNIKKAEDEFQRN